MNRWNTLGSGATASISNLSVTYSATPGYQATPPTPDRYIAGDFAPLNPSNPQYDYLGNLITNGVASANRNDTLYGSGANDLISTGGGDNYVFSGDDTLISGFGNDLLNGGSGNNTYEYLLPTTGTPTTATINDSTGVGTVYVGDTTTQQNTQLTGTALSGANNTWTDSNGDQYQFVPAYVRATTGTLTISKGLLGASGNQIVINHFDMNAAQNGGYLGIQFAKKASLVAGNGANQFLTGDYAAHDTSATATGRIQDLTLYTSEKSTTAQTITLTLTGGNASDYQIKNGTTQLGFSNGAVTLTLAPGEDNLTLGLIYNGDITQSQNVSLTSTIVDTNNPANDEQWRSVA